MKALLYSLNFFLSLLVLLVIGELKSLKNKDTSVQDPIIESAEPQIEELQQRQVRKIPSDSIIQRSIFHVERKEHVVKELSQEELDKQIVDNKDYILTAIIKFGEAVAMIAVEEKKRPNVPRVTSSQKNVNPSKMYMLGEKIEGSNYKVKNINAHESYVIISNGSRDIKLETNNEKARDIAQTQRDILNQAKIREQRSKAPTNTRPPSSAPKSNNKNRKDRKPSGAKVPERVI